MLKKAQNHYSVETLRKLYDKILKTKSKDMSEPLNKGGKEKQVNKKKVVKWNLSI